MENDIFKIKISYSNKNIKYVNMCIKLLKVIVFAFLINLQFNRICISQEKMIEIDKLFRYAEALFNVEEYGRAKETYLKIIYMYPKNKYTDESQYKVGECLQRQWNYWCAIKEWEKLIEQYPDSRFVTRAKEQIKLAKKYLEESEPPILTIEEQLANRYIDRGNQHLNNSVVSIWGLIKKQSEFDEALNWYDKAISICPNGHLAAKAQYMKGELYMRFVQQDNYEKYYQILNDEDRTYLMKAIEEYQKVIDNYPDTYWAKRAGIKIGDIYRENLRDKIKAIDAYQNVINRIKDQDNYYVRYSSAQLVYLTKYFDEENKLIKGVMHNLNYIYWGSFTAKEELAKKYIELGDKFKERSVRSGEYGPVYNKEELETAFYYYNEAIRLCPNSEIAAKAQFKIGDAYTYQGRQSDYEKSVIEYQKVIDNYPNSIVADEAGIKIGDIYKDNLIDKDKAIEAYRRVIERRIYDKNNFYVQYALTQIKYLGGSSDFIEKIKNP